MLARTKTRHTDNKLVSLTFKVHAANVERIKRYVQAIEPEQGEVGSITAEEFFDRYFPGESKPAVALRGARGRQELTQKQLADLTGIPQRHISEMEHDKRPIGKENARKLAAALNTDYRVFL